MGKRDMQFFLIRGVFTNVLGAFVAPRYLGESRLKTLPPGIFEPLGVLKHL